MKTSALLLAAIAATTALLGAPVDYQKPDPTYINFTKRSGKWEDAKNWDRKQVPDKDQAAIIRDNASVTLSTKVPLVGTVHVGGMGVSTLTVSEGGQLEILDKLHVSRSRSNSTALLFIDGGSVRVGLNTQSSIAKMELGFSQSTSCNAWTKIKSGSFEGGMLIGNHLPNTGTGTLSVIGSKPVVRANIGRDSILLNTFGTLEFILDEEGVAGMDYTKSSVKLAKGSAILVEGSAYTGGPKTFVLLQSKKFTNEGARMSCSGFNPAKYDASVFFDRARGIVLRIKTK